MFVCVCGKECTSKTLSIISCINFMEMFGEIKRKPKELVNIIIDIIYLMIAIIEFFFLVWFELSYSSGIIIPIRNQTGRIKIDLEAANKIGIRGKKWIGGIGSLSSGAFATWKSHKRKICVASVSLSYIVFSVDVSSLNRVV